MLRLGVTKLLSLAVLQRSSGLLLSSMPLRHTALQRAAAIRVRSIMSTPIPGFGTTFTILKPGDGAAVVKGATVTVHATGVVQETGKKFWSTKDPDQQPFTYTAGVGSVITGWDQGLLGMKLREERKLVIPADEGYGKQGFPAWGIPAGGTLEFTLEVLSIE
uniref:peptidylprolyl isomerase n=1 Tax=Haptolina ericina TaxID=156174 RepID=A0A7S3AKN3_9EUKA|mmetsp:Transcript_1987/g.4451  ORF Transcript_1987/g.4451 Transcript_1987/m.4451 type:complete len:162 (+) Transcript_1987:36-521(+)